MRTKALSFLCLLSLLWPLAGCTTLADGPYQRDQVLYQADVAITTSYELMHTFVKWEYDNRAALAAKPEIKRAADKVRLNARAWVTSALALREAYAGDPNAENRQRLDSALAVLRAAMLEATKYLVETPTP